jgi:hypothetical protein
MDVIFELVGTSSGDDLLKVNHRRDGMIVYCPMRVISAGAD